MGVPSFYRWLVGRYPKIVENAVEQQAETIDYSNPNPHGREFDNLYLDMNGIIHPCFHPDEQLFPPSTFDEVFAAIFEYIDRIFCIVRPRKLLYMAIDGVAPRAKMNQQRSRRFQTAKEVELANIEEKKLSLEFEREGKMVLPIEENEVSDSNVITPGTVFMAKLAEALKYYIRSRLNSDPGWESIKVILSDANVPGEGEHKIMSFIRLQRSTPGYDPYTRHCLYGLDADLIILALATHEINFAILREDVLKCVPHENVVASLETNLSRKEYSIVKSRQWFVNLANKGKVAPKKPYQFLNILTLREYLELDMDIVDPPCKIDFERIVDDFIFICFLSGNDFLPRLPSLEINEGAIDLLIYVYKQIFTKMGGYLVDTRRMKGKNPATYIEVKRLERFILEVGSYEDKIFEKRYKIQQKRMERLYREKLEERSKNDMDSLDDSNGTTGNSNMSDILGSLSQKCKISESDQISKAARCGESDVLENTKELRRKLKDFLRHSSDLFKNGIFDNDKVRLGYPGWKARYYREKFSACNSSEIETRRKTLVERFVEGLCWVLNYYFVGVCSWSWYYPYYYPPFASDFKGISCSHVQFKVGDPFKPFDQLMAVLPSRSSSALPEIYRNLMDSEDSPIIGFYPEDFVVDTDGKHFTWQGVPKLPFVEEEPLLAATKECERKLMVDEKDRNTFKFDKIYVRDSHILSSEISSLLEIGKDGTKTTMANIGINRCGLSGFLTKNEDESNYRYFTCPVGGIANINQDHSLSATYRNPEFHDHIPELLVPKPEKTITEADITERVLWHEYDGSRQAKIINPQRNAERVGEYLNSSLASDAGTGWRGRGKPLPGYSVSTGNVSFDAAQSGPRMNNFAGGSRQMGRGSGSHQPVYTNTGLSGASGCVQTNAFNRGFLTGNNGGRQYSASTNAHSSSTSNFARGSHQMGRGFGSHQPVYGNSRTGRGHGYSGASGCIQTNAFNRGFQTGNNSGRQYSASKPYHAVWSTTNTNSSTSSGSSHRSPGSSQIVRNSSSDTRYGVLLSDDNSRNRRPSSMAGDHGRGRSSNRFSSIGEDEGGW
ncbi:5'-3' exoribonuclease 2-like [Iris pallida]|uniref:5'-3' exoribonuclease n=1 Tax=Iris pallida TaxID=29817 RepID=A0AAX6FWY5_IRIPA|nr:5'-3' exoribonuclease 2-like [Iris pallida]